MALSPSQMATLTALCARIVPLVEPVAAARLAAMVGSRLGGGDPGLERKVAKLLTLLGHPATPLLFGGWPRSLGSLSATAQDAWLRTWEASRVPAKRTVFQAVRRLILSTFYADAGSHAAIGYPGPLHERSPVVPWEGPLPGTSRGSEPVARGTAPASPALRRDSASTSPSEPAFHGAGGKIRADVCVVGTGAGGAVAAQRLAAAGYDVVMLEEGSQWSPAEFTEREAEMTARLYADRGVRSTDDLAFSLLQGRCVGGSTTVNWMIMLRARESVLDEWAEEHGTEGMRLRDLDPVYTRVERETHTRLVPADAHSASNRALLDGCARLGWSAYPGAINAAGCVRSGFCGLGCRYDAKQGTAATYVPEAIRQGARLFADVRAERVTVVERGGSAPLKRVSAVRLDRTTGAVVGEFIVEAPIVILAAGAVGTPILLQRSGLGGGGVGRFLRLHPTTSVIGRYRRPILASAGIPLSAVCDEFMDGAGDGYGFWMECPPLYPGIAAAALPGFGAPHRSQMEDFPSLGSFIVLVRDGANRRRSDGEVLLDRRGRTRIRYRLGNAERGQLVQGLKAAARVHLAADADEAFTLHSGGCRIRSEREIDRIDDFPCGPNQIGLFSAHVNGTCRIGSSPRTSGCTPDGERHGVPGLYVADGSLLPTAPGVNPQATIMAVSTVIAERIAARHQGVVRTG